MYILVYRNPISNRIIKEEYEWFADISRNVESRLSNPDFEFISVTYTNTARFSEEVLEYVMDEAVDNNLGNITKDLATIILIDIQSNESIKDLHDDLSHETLIEYIKKHIK